MREENNSRGLNAVGKPYGPNFDPNYKLKGARTSTAHLRFPYLRVKFVGEGLRETPHRRQQPKPKPKIKPKTKTKPKLKESATALLNWKENTRKAEFTARAPLSIGGFYILAPFLHCWNVDHRGKRGGGRRQLGFAHTLDEAKAIAQVDSVQGNGYQIRSAPCP